MDVSCVRRHAVRGSNIGNGHPRQVGDASSLEFPRLLGFLGFRVCCEWIRWGFTRVAVCPLGFFLCVPWGSCNIFFYSVLGSRSCNINRHKRSRQLPKYEVLSCILLYSFVQFSLVQSVLDTNGGWLGPPRTGNVAEMMEVHAAQHGHQSTAKASAAAPVALSRRVDAVNTLSWMSSMFGFGLL
ncbi:hypothetical protein V1506DRAFT_546711 [Lipomyces tetrasporus]